MKYLEEGMNGLVEIGRWTLIGIITLLSLSVYLVKAAITIAIFFVVWALLATYVTGSSPLAGVITLGLVVIWYFTSTTKN